MSRDKLSKLGIELPLLPITAVGSYAKPSELVKARARYRNGKISKDELRKFQEEATSMWMGFENGDWVRSYGNRYYRKPIVNAEIRWRGPITVDWWKFAQSLTDKPVKGMFTGGYTVMDWSFNEFYPDRRATALALARELRKEA